MNRLLTIISILGLAMLSGCGKGDSEESLEKEFRAMQPRESELGNFDAKLPFPDDQKKSSSAQPVSKPWGVKCR